MKSIEKKTLIYAIVFAISIFLQCVLFQWRLTGTIIISSLWYNTSEFCAYYMPKMAIALFFTSFVFLFRRKYWTIYASVLIDIWLLVELVYYRAFGFMLDSSTMLIATNMKGFGGSIMMYLMLPDVILLLPTILLAIVLYFCNTKERNWLLSIALIIASFFFETIGMCCFHVAYRSTDNLKGTEFEEYNELLIPYNEYHFNPFTQRAFYGMYDISNIQITSEKYVRYHSAIHHFIYNVKDICIRFLEGNAIYKMTEKEKDKVINLCLNQPQPVNPNSKLIICLIESWENWVVRPDVMPNLCKFIDTHESIFWATKIKKQIKAGGSADGQMIINTGLLPISEGSACFNYSSALYPSLSACYTPTINQKDYTIDSLRSYKSAILVPHDLTVWNQNKMSAAYGIQENIRTGGTDKEIMDAYMEIMGQYDYTMIITFSTHNPFDGHIYSMLETPQGMPDLMARYIKSNNYLDECMEGFLSSIDTNEDMGNTTIVFVGDHTVFYPEQRVAFADYCRTADQDYDVTAAYGPLIIYSPKITKKEKYEEPSYQMDVYPTVLKVIGCENYYWKGVGVDLRDSIARNNRPLDEIEAYDLSDKLIRSNFFREYLKSEE